MSIIAKGRETKLAPKPLISKLPDGRIAIILDKKVTAAGLVTFGDTDANKKQGVRAIAFADIPFDSDENPRAMLDTGEISLKPEEAMEQLNGLMSFLASALRWLLPR